MLHTTTHRPALAGRLTLHPAPLYTSREMLIGKHRWRAVVIAHPLYGNNVEYEWRNATGGMWQPARLWRGYDPDHYDHGLPARLSDLYEAETPQLAHFVPGIAARLARRAQQELQV